MDTQKTIPYNAVTTEIVAIYLRKSRSDEGLDALRNHKAVLTRLAEEKGFQYEIYEEIGSSISLDARESMNDLLKNIGKYSMVLVMDLDRLARSMSVMDEIKDTLRYNNVKILTPANTYDLNNESSEMMMDFQSVIAKAEYQQIRKRMQIGKVEGARQGYWVNGVAPLGYSYDKKARKLVINEQEYPLVRHIFKMALENKSYTEIGVNLNLRGYRTRLGNMFAPDGIKTILTNRAYVGDVIYRRKSNIKGGQDTVITAHNAHPPIISEADYLEIQRLIQNRRTNIGKTQTHVKSMVQGLCYCAYCGAKLSIQVMGKDHAGEKYIKGCWKVDGFGERCSNKSIKSEIVEQVIVDALQSQKDKAEKEVKALLKADTSSLEADIRKALTMAQNEIKQIEEKNKRLLDLYVEGDLEKEVYLKKKAQYVEQIDFLKNDCKRLELKLSSLDVDAQVDRLKRVLYALDNFDRLELDEANRFLQTLVKRITIKVAPDTDSIYRRAKAEPEIAVEWMEEMA